LNSGMLLLILSRGSQDNWRDTILTHDPQLAASRCHECVMRQLPQRYRRGWRRDDNSRARRKPALTCVLQVCAAIAGSGQINRARHLRRTRRKDARICVSELVVAVLADLLQDWRRDLWEPNLAHLGLLEAACEQQRSLQR
jgi:hypothetical protein